MILMKTMYTLRLSSITFWLSLVKKLLMQLNSEALLKIMSMILDHPYSKETLQAKPNNFRLLNICITEK